MATEKFKELILYIAQESEFDPSFGSTKLNKILFFCDFLAYRAHGESISGQRYFKLRYGPAPRALKPALAELVESGACIEFQSSHFNRPQNRILVKREADTRLFEPREIRLVNSVLQALRDSNAQEVSDLSHHFVGWQIAGEREDIPYESIFLGAAQDFSLTEAEIAYGQELERELAEA